MGARENKGPCRRNRKRELTLCKPLVMSLASGIVGIDVHQSINFKTGKLTSYVGARADRKAPVMLFNVCPFCRFEYAVNPPPADGTTKMAVDNNERTNPRRS